MKIKQTYLKFPFKNLVIFLNLQNLVVFFNPNRSQLAQNFDTLNS